jgi:hypothetical protein
MMSAAVEFEDLTVERGGRPVLHGISGSFGAGRVVGLFGPIAIVLAFAAGALTLGAATLRRRTD